MISRERGQFSVLTNIASIASVLVPFPAEYEIYLNISEQPKLICLDPSTGVIFVLLLRDNIIVEKKKGAEFTLRLPGIGHDLWQVNDEEKIYFIVYRGHGRAEYECKSERRTYALELIKKSWYGANPQSYITTYYHHNLDNAMYVALKDLRDASLSSENGELILIMQQDMFDTIISLKDIATWRYPWPGPVLAPIGERRYQTTGLVLFCDMVKKVAKVEFRPGGSSPFSFRPGGLDIELVARLDDQRTVFSKIICILCCISFISKLAIREPTEEDLIDRCREQDNEFHWLPHQRAPRHAVVVNGRIYKSLSLGIKSIRGDKVFLHTALDLDGAGISSLRDISDLGRVRFLHTLSLRNNCIDELDKVPVLDDLRRLYISSNRITCIRDVSGIHNLRWLDLGNNNIDRLDWIHFFPDLEVLMLHGNVRIDPDMLLAEVSKHLRKLVYLTYTRNGVDKARFFNN